MWNILPLNNNLHLGVKVTELEGFELPQADFCHGARYLKFEFGHVLGFIQSSRIKSHFSRDEGLPSSRTLVVEEDPVDGEHIVRLAEVDDRPVKIKESTG